MDERDLLASRFEEHRSRLRAVAYRMLGSPSEEDDAVPEARLRLDRSGSSGVEKLGGWLTTVVGRVPEHAALAQIATRAVPRRAVGRNLGRPHARPYRG